MPPASISRTSQTVTLNPRMQGWPERCPGMIVIRLRSMLVVLSGTIATFGISPEGIGLILGVDAFMDMARTSVNVLGNCLASAVVGRWEGVAYQTDMEDAEVHGHIEAAA